MAEVLLFHHAQGLTDGVRQFGDRLRAAGHRVTVPDLYGGRTFGDLEDGVAYAKEVGFGTIQERGGRAAEGLPRELVYAGFSLGVIPAQMLAQTRAGARGALLYHGCMPAAEFGTGWPQGVALQVHGMDADPEFANGYDLEAARELVGQVDQGELFLYPGEGHLFADSSLPAYDPGAAELLLERTLAFLERWG